MAEAIAGTSPGPESNPLMVEADYGCTAFRARAHAVIVVPVIPARSRIRVDELFDPQTLPIFQPPGDLQGAMSGRRTESVSGGRRL